MVTKGYGFTVDDIDWSCPADLKPYAQAYKMELTEKDSFIHAICGHYVLSAVSVAVEQCLFGQKAKSQYIKEPIIAKALRNSKDEFTEKDIQMAILTEKRYITMAINKGLPETKIK